MEEKKMKIKLDKTDSTVIKSNETYDVIDNTNLDKLMKGEGKMVVGTKTYNVKAGDTILIPDGDFHKVWNTGGYDIEPYGDLEFICVFDGGRNH